MTHVALDKYSTSPLLMCKLLLINGAKMGHNEKMKFVKHAVVHNSLGMLRLLQALGICPLVLTKVKEGMSEESVQRLLERFDKVQSLSVLCRQTMWNYVQDRRGSMLGVTRGANMLLPRSIQSYLLLEDIVETN